MRHTAAYDEVVIRANVGLLIRLTSLGSTISVAGNGFGFGLFSAVLSFGWRRKIRYSWRARATLLSPEIRRDRVPETLATRNDASADREWTVSGL